MQWLQDPDLNNVDNLHNVNCVKVVDISEKKGRISKS
jgi:hypothetical protein